MTENDDRGAMTPHTGSEKEPGIGPILDPLAAITETIGDDPTMAELVALRDSNPDLKAAAREFRRCSDKSLRLAFGDQPNLTRMARVGLEITAQSCAALVAIWPVDTLDDADAKLALAETDGPYGTETDYGTASMLDHATAARIRLRRATYNVGELVIPAGPAGPRPTDRGLGRWPLTRFDLVDEVPARGGDATLGHTQMVRWSELIDGAPDLAGLTRRIVAMFAIADRLQALAEGTVDDSRQHRRAAEGARIVAYLLAARAAIWPALRHTSDADAKAELIALINARASRRDPLHMQAAIRHLVSEANLIAKRYRYGATVQLDPAWIPIV